MTAAKGREGGREENRSPCAHAKMIMILARACVRAWHVHAGHRASAVPPPPISASVPLLQSQNLFPSTP